MKQKLFYIPNAPRGLILFIVIMWVCLGLGCTGYGAVKMTQMITLHRDCTEIVTAYPLSVETYDANFIRKPQEHGRRRYFDAELEYTVDGETYETAHTFREYIRPDGTTENDHSQPVDVLYDPSDPSRLYWGDDNTGALVLYLLFGVLLLTGGFWFLFANRDALRRDA